jgi:hypothetical protein
MDIIKINVPTFLRLFELTCEEVKNDTDLHNLSDAVSRISQKQVVTMDHYNEIVGYMKSQGTTDELAKIRKLGGF